VVEALRRRGIDALSAAEGGLRKAADEAYLHHALASDRVVVTHDSDFLRLHASGVEHSGIVYCQQGKLSVGALVTARVLIHELLEPDDIAQRVEFL